MHLSSHPPVSPAADVPAGRAQGSMMLKEMLILDEEASR